MIIIIVIEKNSKEVGRLKPGANRQSPEANRSNFGTSIFRIFTVFIP